MLSSYPADDQKTGFIQTTGRDFDQVRIIPESLRLVEVNTVLVLVGFAFFLVEFKFHSHTLGCLGIYCQEKDRAGQLAEVRDHQKGGGFGPLCFAAGILDNLSLPCDSQQMKYEIETTNVFDRWLAGIKDITFRARIISRFDRIQLGSFGDHKNLGDGLFELRFFFGPGFRAYYTIRVCKVVFLLCGGDKSSQSKDIERAKAIMEELEQDHE